MVLMEVLLLLLLNLVFPTVLEFKVSDTGFVVLCHHLLVGLLLRNNNIGDLLTSAYDNVQVGNDLCLHLDIWGLYLLR